MTELERTILPLITEWRKLLTREMSFIFDVERCISVRLRHSIEEIGSLSIDDANGSENVGFKMNSRFFNRFRVYSLLLKMASVSEFSWS